MCQPIAKGFGLSRRHRLHETYGDCLGKIHPQHPKDGNTSDSHDAPPYLLNKNGKDGIVGNEAHRKAKERTVKYMRPKIFPERW